MEAARERLVDFGFATTQTSKSELEVLENVRAAQARKKRRQRAAKAAGRTDVPGDSTGGWSPGTAQEGRIGQDRKDRTTHATTDESDATAAEIDADYTADLRDWCAESERNHLEVLADRNTRDGYDR